MTNPEERMPICTGKYDTELAIYPKPAADASREQYLAWCKTVVAARLDRERNTPFTQPFIGHMSVEAATQCTAVDATAHSL